MPSLFKEHAGIGYVELHETDQHFPLLGLPTFMSKILHKIFSSMRVKPLINEDYIKDTSCLSLSLYLFPKSNQMPFTQDPAKKLHTLSTVM